ERAWTAAPGRRELSQPQSQRTVQRADGRAVGHREPDRHRASALQRTRARVRHVEASIPGEHYGEAVQLQGLSVLRSAARGDAGAQGQLLEILGSRARFV